MTQLQKIICITYTTVLNFLAPPFCSYCKQFLSTRTIFCDYCYVHIKPIVSMVMPITKSQSMKIFAVSAYQEPIKSLILAKGFSNIAASVHLGNLITGSIKCIDFDYIIPIPLHWTRFAQRGYNQSAIMAQVLAQKSNKQFFSILKRSRRTVFQSSLSSDQRNMNLNNAFVLSIKNCQQVKGKRILLIDDLMTTGATLRSAAKVLVPLKPASIMAIVACRVV